MRTKGELCALAAAALAISGITASKTDALDIADPNPATECGPPIKFADLWVQAVVLAWTDEGFKQRLLEDPARALKVRFNYHLPPGIELKIVEGQPGAPEAYMLTLPPKPEDGFPDFRQLRKLEMPIC